MSPRHLPLITLYLTDRCNSRCVTCDYWRYGRTDINREAVVRMLPSLARLRTKAVLISGGEPLVHAEWDDIARLLKSNGLKLWLVTSGLGLAKHATRVAELFDAVTVSLDGTDRETYLAIRGLDALERVREGVRAAVALGIRVTVRVTLQRANFKQLSRFVELAKEDGAAGVSFLAVDVANPHAFARTDPFTPQLALRAEDLPRFDQALSELERDFAAEFRSRFILETPAKLRRIHDYFTALCGLGSYPQVRCNAPEFSAVVDAHGSVHPCFFIPGPPRGAGAQSLEDAVSGVAMSDLRAAIETGGRRECATCVCPLWRDPQQFGALVPARVSTFAA